MENSPELLFGVTVVEAPLASVAVTLASAAAGTAVPVILPWVGLASSSLEQETAVVSTKPAAKRSKVQKRTKYRLRMKMMEMDMSRQRSGSRPGAASKAEQ